MKVEVNETIPQDQIERYEGSWEKPQKSLTTAAIMGLIIVGVVYFYGLNIVTGVMVLTRASHLHDNGGTFIQKMTNTVMATKGSIRLSVMVCEFVFMLAPTLWIIRRWHTKRILSYIRFKRAPVSEILIAIATTVLFIPVTSYIGEFLMRELHFPDFLAQIDEQIFTSYTPKEFIWLIAVVCITPAICEETLFRGYLQRTLERTLGLRSLFVAGIIFGLFHMQPINLISLSLLGMLIGFFYYRSGSILPGMVAHFTNNLLAILSLYKMPNGKPVVAVLSNETPFLGFVACILLSTIAVIVFRKLTERNFRRVTIQVPAQL